jgi:hypothetical protein
MNTSRAFPAKKTQLVLAIVVPLLLGTGWAAEKSYVGSRVCGDCHETEYARFADFAKKSHSFQSIEKLKDGLSEQEIQQCYSCHTTGYGKPGGFVSAEKTPELKNAGCEVCHGPGSLHLETEDPADIKGRLEIEDCMVCHTSQRVAAFSFKPLIHSGAH